MITFRVLTRFFLSSAGLGEVNCPKTRKLKSESKLKISSLSPSKSSGKDSGITVIFFETGAVLVKDFLAWSEGTTTSLTLLRSLIQAGLHLSVSIAAVIPTLYFAKFGSHSLGRITWKETSWSDTFPLEYSIIFPIRPPKSSLSRSHVVSPQGTACIESLIFPASARLINHLATCRLCTPYPLWVRTGALSATFFICLSTP